MPAFNPALYVAREIDSEVVREACAWNTAPGRPHAYWIHLQYETDTGVHWLLESLLAELPSSGFLPVYVDAQEVMRPEVTGQLAWSIHQLLGRKKLRRIKRSFRNLRSLPIHKLVAAAAMALPLAAMVLLAVEAKTYLSSLPPHPGPRDFATEYVPNQWRLAPERTLLDLFGVAVPIELFLMALRILFQKRTTWDDSASADFADAAGYLHGLKQVAGRLPLAILIDRASHLSDKETEVINHLLRNDEFRGVFISANIPAVLDLGRVRQKNFPVPKLPEKILAAARASDERIRKRVAAQWVHDENEDGIIGAYEWTAFCAVLDRRKIYPDEMQQLYEEVIGAKELLRLLGLPGEHPVKPPETKLRDEGAAPESFDEAYCRAEQTEIGENRPELLAKVRCMLIIPGLNLEEGRGRWRDWPDSRVRAILAAAEHASDLADDTPADDPLEILVGDAPQKLTLLRQVMNLLVTGAEISRVSGNIRASSSYLESASRLYGPLEDCIGEELRTNFFYQWWICFWLSCEPRDQANLRTFESDHPSIREHNAWKILRGHENYRARLPLWDEEPTDPGPANPELANVLNLTLLREGLSRIYGGDYDEAAKSPDFKLRQCYEEPFATAEGLLLLWSRHSLLARRDSGKTASEALAERLSALRERSKPDWIGDGFLLDGWSLWLDYARVRSLAVKPVEQAAFERERAALKTRYDELRNRALVRGFRRVVLQASDNLAWLLMGEGTSDSLDQEHLKQLIVDAEPYFREVLEIERDLDWHLYTPAIYGKRFNELAGRDQPRVVDDAIALYRELEVGGLPRSTLLYYLNKTSQIVFNNILTSEHARQSARLHEKLAAMFKNAPNDSSYWVKKTIEEETAYRLMFAVDGWIRAGELDEARRVLTEAQEMLDQAEAKTAGEDGIRESRVSIWLRLAQLAAADGNRDEYAQRLAECWADTHPKDTESSFVFRLVLAGEEEVGILRERASLDTFARQSTNPSFAPGSDLVSGHTEEITRFHWRFLQFRTHASALREANDHGFFTAVLLIGGLVSDETLDDNCRDALLGLLWEAVEYFHSKAASNADERTAIQLLGVLDPSPSPELQRRLAEIAEEDRLFDMMREKELEGAFDHSNWQDSFLALDLGTLGPEAQGYLTESREAIERARALLAAGESREAFDLLSRRAKAIEPERLTPADLVLSHLRSVAASPGDRAWLHKKFEEMTEAFVEQRYPNAERTDWAAVIKRRFAELERSHRS